MDSPTIPLCVPVMDADHVRLETLLRRATAMGDAGLPALFEEIEAETRAHFGREEDLMRAAGVPVLCCHASLHEQFLSEFDRGRDAIAHGDMAALRLFLCAALPRLLLSHVDSADRVTASFLRGGHYGQNPAQIG
jgi:hemerythrin-like metal-binding protein